LPCSEPHIHLSLRDRQDKDKWCERTLDLADLFQHSRDTIRPVAFERPFVDSPDPRKYVSGQGMVHRKRHQTSQFESTGNCGPNAFQINLKSANFPHTVAKMWASFEVLPEADSYIRRAGLGRNHPNKLNAGVIATPKVKGIWDMASSFCCGK